MDIFIGNNEKENKEEESLIKETSKKAISKLIKGLPLKTKLIIAGILAGVLVILFTFIVLLVPTLMILGEDVNSSVTSETKLSYIESNSSDNYWWPIGGSTIEIKDSIEYATGDPVSLTITSDFGYRLINGTYSNHSGIDIASSGQTDYIIAVMNGTVYSVNNSCDNNGYYGNPCGSSYGNYVVIEHSNGIYTRYAHLYPNSIRVKVGDSVSQGQIIAEMGNSGSSTGKHLHFEVDSGGVGSNYAVNPLDYINKEDPRPVSTTNSNIELLKMLHEMEGTGPVDGDNYIIYLDTANVLTVGHGVTLESQKDKFLAHGINVDNLHEGSQLPKTMVDTIESEIISSMRTYIKNELTSNDINLESYQEDALLLRMYNVGNINNFIETYKQYGVTDDLYTYCMSKPNTAGGVYSQALANRRYKEWILFTTGVYTYSGE